MDGFTPRDHDRLAELHGWREDVDRKLELIEQHQRRLPGRIVRRAVSVIGKKTAILLAIGVLIGQLLGTAAASVVQKLISIALGH